MRLLKEILSNCRTEASDLNESHNHIIDAKVLKEKENGIAKRAMKPKHIKQTLRKSNCLITAEWNQ